jgi:hypothetical protein
MVLLGQFAEGSLDRGLVRASVDIEYFVVITLAHRNLCLFPTNDPRTKPGQQDCGSNQRRPLTRQKADMPGAKIEKNHHANRQHEPVGQDRV